jgi:hypothetical protein
VTTLLDVLQHALGRDAYGRQLHPRDDGSDYRNHFTTGEGGSSFAACEQATADGLMVRHAPSELSGGDYVYTVTEKGREYVAANSPKPPRLSRSALRYRAFLDEDGGENFGEWLRLQKHRRAQL